MHYHQSTLLNRSIQIFPTMLGNGLKHIQMKLMDLWFSFCRYSLSHHAERYISTGLYTIESIYYLPENNSIQHKSCMHTLSGHTSKAEHAVMQRLALLFRNAHAIAKAGGRPFSDMECALDEKGLDVGASYRTDKKCCEFIHCIAEEQRLGLQANTVQQLLLCHDGWHYRFVCQ